MAQTNIIELNGKRYDAVTGKFLGEGAAAARASAKQARRGRSMDIIPTAQPHKAAAPAREQHGTKPAPAKVAHTATSKDETKGHHAPRNQKVIAAHQPQKSTILMRGAVKKPAFKLKTAIKTQTPTEMVAAPISTIVPKASAYRLEPRRAARAQSVARSQHIQRFAAQRTTSAITPVAAPVTPTSSPQPLARSGMYAVPARTAAHGPTRRQAGKSEHPHVSKTAPSQDIFEAAIAHAASHLEPAPKVSRHHNRWLHITAVAITFLAVGAAVMWANKTNIEAHFASMRAGFHIMMPAYSPDGYTLSGNVQADNGKVTLTYRSGAASYGITEQASSWDSATLASSTVALQHTPQQMQTAGRTVYLYGNGNAMWVDGGVLYNLVANGSLTNAEIANLVAGL